MEILPYVSVGQIRLHESRQRIRDLLGRGFEPFRKAAGCNETDAYDELGLHLYYDGNDCLEFVETFEPASPSFRGITMIGKELADVLSEFDSIGFRFSFADDVSLQCDDAGIALYAPDGVVEAVSIFRRGYYDTQR